MKTPFTSVSEDADCLKHIGGDRYFTKPDSIVAGGHGFRSHLEIVTKLRASVLASRRGERVLAQRALQLAQRAREALISWRFSLGGIERKDRISWCGAHIQAYFARV